MLPSELARYKLHKDSIIPIFATEDDLIVFQEVYSLFKEGKRLGEILEDMKYLAKIYDPKLVKGIVKILLRKFTLDRDSPIEPRIIRRKLFEGGPALTEEERASRINKVREELNLDPIRFMYSDLEEEKVLVKIEKVDVKEILKEYNLSLLQTILLKSYKMTVYLKEGWKEVVKRGKLLGLMYSAYENPLRVDFYGPATLVKLTERYGRNFALLLPYIVATKGWRIEAEVVVGKKNKRLMKLEVSDFPLIKANVKVEEKYFDSTIEERFYSEFLRILRDWKIRREPEPVVIGDSLFFPDFVAEKENLKVYVEIVGFWTKEYLRSKLEKLRKLKEPCLVIVNEELGYGDFSGLDVIFFKRKVDMGKVYKWFKDYEAKLTPKREDEKEKIVLRLGEGEEGKYVKIGNLLVKREVAEKILNEDFSGRPISELISIYGSWITEVLNELGYKVVWKDVTNGIVVKKK